MKHAGKRILAAALACVCALPVCSYAAGNTANVSLPMGGTMVLMEMGPGRTGEVTLANGRLFQAQAASGHVSAKTAEGGKAVVASVNGGYFDSYSGGNRLYATVIQNGEVVNGGGHTPVLAFTAGGTPLIDRVKIESKVVFRNEGDAEKSEVTAYAVNDYNASNSWGVYLITSKYGRALNVASGAQIVTMQDSTVISIASGGTVPALSGATTALVINQDVWNNMTKYHTEPQVGNAAVAKIVYTPDHDAASKWTGVVNGIGAGPLLLKNGVDMCDQNPDFTDPKQGPDYSSSRSFVAIMGDGRLAVGSATNTTMRRIAQYLKEQGAVDAMALDGGASTFLSAGGSTVHSAGRNLASVLHIVDYSSKTLPQGVQARDFDTPSSWAASTMSSAAAAGVVPEALQNGYRKNITRREFCQLIDKLLQKKMTNYSTRLDQTGITYDAARQELLDTYDLAVINCYRFGVVSGVGENQFNPNGSLTREQAATILMHASRLLGASEEGGEAVSFTDAADISRWAAQGVDYVTSHKIMKGTGGGFRPKGLFTREQAISTIYQML